MTNNNNKGGWLLAVVLLTMTFVSVAPLIYDKGWNDALKED